MLTQLRRFLKPKRLTGGLAGFCFGVLIAAVTDTLAAQSIAILAAIAVVALIAWFVSLLIQYPSDIEVSIKSPLTIRNRHEAARFARSAFIGFVPLYRPKRGTAAAALSPQERQTAIETLDFDRLQLEESNLEPTITAICAHQTQLRHCWLIATLGAEAPGSLPYARLLAEYLHQRKGLTCDFHYGQQYAVPLEDDALVLSKTYDLVRQVFAESKRYNILQRGIVADITTGFRSMTLGMVLASLDRSRDIEFIGTRYNSDGEPQGDLTPIIFSFEPALNNDGSQ
ncbi:MAG: hypothetical protein AAGG53_03980 [Cyanobacteria bacterium P01_H01_bin.152]